MKKRKVGIIGSLCSKLDGQTIKTMVLYNELKNKTDWQFYIANTKNKNNPIKMLAQTLRVLLTCKDIFILVSSGGARVYFPMLYYAAKILKTRIYHDVIGGCPEDCVIKNPNNKKYLNSFVVNWAETETMCKDLLKVGVKNAKPLPNFKRLNCLKPNDVKLDFKEPLALCTFSRVIKEKGIEDAIEAVASVNKAYKRTVFTLDIYGSIEKAYENQFKNVIKNSSAAINYCGHVPYDKSVETLSRYYALLFPTYWRGEGFPGTIVDAFSSGLPVIATDFHANGEIIENMKTGIVYPNSTITSLAESLKWAERNRQEFISMRKNCIKEAEKYQPDEHIKTIIAEVEKNKP